MLVGAMQFAGDSDVDHEHDDRRADVQYDVGKERVGDVPRPRREVLGTRLDDAEQTRTAGTGPGTRRLAVVVPSAIRRSSHAVGTVREETEGRRWRSGGSRCSGGDENMIRLRAHDVYTSRNTVEITVKRKFIDVLHT